MSSRNGFIPVKKTSTVVILVSEILRPGASHGAGATKGEGLGCGREAAHVCGGAGAGLRTGEGNSQRCAPLPPHTTAQAPSALEALMYASRTAAGRMAAGSALLHSVAAHPARPAAEFCVEGIARIPTRNRRFIDVMCKVTILNPMTLMI
jgi:hypothetical protein